MKAVRFLKWLFDFSTWDWYTIRILTYILIGVVGSFFTLYSIPIILGLFTLDLSYELLKDKSEEFTRIENEKT